MATERGGFNPVAVLVHLVAIAAGIYLGLLVMNRIVPDLPDETVDPGVSSSSAPAAVAGDDPDSLFLASNLGPALTQLEAQLGAGQGIATLHLEPGSLDAETASGDAALHPADIPVEVPALLGEQIHADRGGVGLAEISYIDLVATARGPRWYVQLDPARGIGPPPWSYGAPLDGSPLTAGPAPPKPAG